MSLAVDSISNNTYVTGGKYYLETSIYETRLKIACISAFVSVLHIIDLLYLYLRFCCCCVFFHFFSQRMFQKNDFCTAKKI